MKSFIVVFALISTTLMAQTKLPDSVRNRFADATEDSIYINELNSLATQYLKSNPTLTRALANEVIDVAPRIKYTRGYARGLTLMGNSYWYEGIYEFAQNYYLLAARQYQSINDSVGLGQTFNNIGEIYKKQRDYANALSYLKRSLELKRRDTSVHAITLYNIGELYIAKGDLKEGRAYIDRSLTIAQRQGNRRVIAFDYWALGALHRKKKDLAGALHFYLESERLWLELGEMRSLIQTYQSIAEIYLGQKNFEQCDKYLSKAMSMASELKVADLQVNNFLRFAQLDSVRGNYQRSLYYLHGHNALKDSVYNLLKAEQIARMQTIYETETREQENTLLKNEKAMQESQLKTQQTTLIGISLFLVLTGVLAWVLYQQRKKISLQKEAIETQAVVLLKLNEELQELNKNLELRIEERTSQLTIQNQRLTEYTFINAHKLRAPVASMLGLINLIQQVEPSEKEEILGHLKTCGEQLDAVIREVSRNLENAIVPEAHKG